MRSRMRKSVLFFGYCIVSLLNTEGQTLPPNQANTAYLFAYFIGNSGNEEDLPNRYTCFKTMVGLDNAAATQNTGATMKFMVYTEDPSGPMPPESAMIQINLKELGFDAACTITDLWSGKLLGKFSGEFVPEINRHGAGFFRLETKSNSSIKNKPRQ